MDREKKKYKVESLGCRTNQYEAQAFRDQLQAMGFEPAKEDEEADLCIVNTCTVTEGADSHSRQLVRQLTRRNPGAKIMVTGCSAERDPDSLQKISNDIQIVPNKDKEKLIQLLLPEEKEYPEFSIKHFEAHTRAFVKVQDGCNSFCTYCIIPYVRGRSRSRSFEEILSEVKTLIASGYKEIVLTGINVGDFDGGVEPPRKLAELIRAVDAIEGLERLRLSSIDPDEVDEELAEAILNGKKTCNSMHLVLQAGSNVVLKRMNRKYTRQIFYETARRLLAQDPDFAFTTDVIVGFPGETEADFEQTKEVLREICFAKVHMFPYSERPRTRAALFTDKLPQETISKRKAELLQLAEETAFQLRQKFIGRTMRILTEGQDEEESQFLMGHTDNFLPVIIPKDNWKANQLLTVEFISNTPKGLIGKVVGE